jgi:pyruvate kinase
MNAISEAAVSVAKTISADAIVAETKTGATAVSIAAFRPNLPIISVTSDIKTAQQLALSYANKSFVEPDGERAGLDVAQRLQNEQFFGNERTTIVIVSGLQPGVAGETDTIRIRVLE